MTNTMPEAKFDSHSSSTYTNAKPLMVEGTRMPPQSNDTSKYTILIKPIYKDSPQGIVWGVSIRPAQTWIKYKTAV